MEQISLYLSSFNYSYIYLFLMIIIFIMIIVLLFKFNKLSKVINTTKTNSDEIINTISDIKIKKDIVNDKINHDIKNISLIFSIINTIKYFVSSKNRKDYKDYQRLEKTKNDLTNIKSVIK